MSSTQVSAERQPATGVPAAATVDLKLEVVVIPVADVDRAKRFYGSLGWRLDADFAFDNGFRVVQYTPPGSGCSIQFGTNITSATPGSARGLYLVVSDVETARNELVARGAEISEVFHASSPGAQFQSDSGSGRVSGPAPNHASYGSFATFSDPDGNSWLLQEIRTRLPGRGFSLDVSTLTELLRETEMHHGQYEPTAPKHHWSDWYAAYLVARQQGRTPEDATKDAAVHMDAVLNRPRAQATPPLT
jgi:catechol 2,3-dioxygenase-like lactoylglutathione lyase family enzyme